MRRILVAVVLTTLSAAGPALGQDDRACVTIARAAAPPSIDGRMLPGEWTQAATLGCFLQAGAGAVSADQTAVGLMFDDRAIYLAFRCLEPDTSRPRGLRRAHDDRVFDDDCIQVFIAPEDLAKAGDARINFGGYAGAYDNWYKDIAAYYEFSVNGQGSCSEARNDVRAWDAPWEARCGRERSAWVCEMAIPFSSLGATRPVAGTLWGLNLFRMRPPGASGWVFPGFGGYTPLPLGAMCFSESGPVAEQPPVPPATMGDNTLVLGVRGGAAGGAEIECTVAATGQEAVVRSAQVGPAGTAALFLPYQFAGTGSLRATYSVKVRGQDAPLLSGFVPLSRPQPYDLTLAHYALPGFVEGTVGLGPDAAAVEAVLTVTGPQGKRGRADVRLAGKHGERLRVSVRGEVGESYSAQLQVLDSGGKVAAERKIDFTIPQKPAWLGTRAGLPLGVLPPWTPMRTSGKTVEMLGKRLEFTDLALPSAVRSAEAQLLASPMRVVVASGGKEVRWLSRRLRTVERAEDHVKLESVWDSGALRMIVTCNIEYDGFCWVEVKLDPRRAQTVDRVALDIPLRPQVARYAYQGHAQAAGALSPYGLSQPISQNLWIGDESRGVAFLAESLEWVKSTDKARQVQITPGRNATVWRSSFIDTPTQLSSPYTASFILHITPAKPVSLRRSRIYHGAYYGMATESAAGVVTIPASGNMDLARGTIEMWVKPNFDPAETYDQSRPRSDYNRQLLFLFSHPSNQATETLILYHNADDRSLRVIKRDAQGNYPVVFSSDVRMAKDQWSYVGLSWGDKLQLSVNGRVVESQVVSGALVGDLREAFAQLLLRSFAVDELRVSSVQRPLDAVPEGPFTADADTLFLHHFDNLGKPTRGGQATPMQASSAATATGKFGHAVASSPDTVVDRLAAEGTRIVIFHENWSRYQGYPDLEQVPKLKAIADACHKHGMLFLVYFCQMMSDAAPEWPTLQHDFMVPPGLKWYHRDDVKQDCWLSCVNGPFGELLLDGIEKLADEAHIDGVYMDGTTLPWECANPTHRGCGQYLGEGAYLGHQPIRATRQFMKRLRNIFAMRGKSIFLDAHTGGCINVATQSFCDGYYDGETLARYKPGFRLSPDTYVTGYMAKQFGFRGDFLPNRHTADEAMAICLIHDSELRGQAATVDRAWGPYEDAKTRLIAYWEKSPLYSVAPRQVLGSLYLKPDRALLVLGSQTETEVSCTVNVTGVLSRLPAGVTVRDAILGEPIPIVEGTLSFPLPGRMWRMIEFRKP